MEGIPKEDGRVTAKEKAGNDVKCHQEAKWEEDWKVAVEAKVGTIWATKLMI